MGDLLIEQIKKIEKGLKEYQPGDLISIGSIKELFDNLVNISLADYGKCKNLINLLETGKELFQKLLSNTTEDISKQLLLSILSNYRIYHEKKSIKDFFDKFKHFQKEFEQLNINYEPEVMCKEYTPGYFDNIIDDQKMLQEFVEECKDHLDNAQYKLLDLEYDYSNQEYINSVFRSFHTIKGSSAFLGIKNIEETAHSIENLLVIVRDGKLKVTKELIDVVFYGIGILRDLVLVIESEKYEKEKIIKCFKEILIFDYIDIVNAIRENYQTKKMGEILLDAGKINQEMIDDILRKQKEVDKKFGEIAVEENIVTEQDIREAVVKQQTAQKNKIVSSYVKVSNERLNTLVDIVGELVINQSMVKQVLESYSNDALDDRIIQQLESITTNIKNLVLSMGMVPISDIFNKLRVVIRNTAMELQKVVSLEISGENTELDRNVIQAIYDPLIHIVRNAVDHGLELPKDREKAGKNKVGKVLIKAEHKGNGIEISVFDDGRGINKEKIIKKAIEKKIYEPAQIESMKEKEIFNLIFLPGFSTAEKVTEVSGRGVGLDVVKKNIEDIRGKIEIESELGKFTKIIIKLPLTLAIIDGFVTEVAGNKYIFPFALIEEIIEPSTVKVNQLENGQIMLQSRGIYIPVIFAEKIFKSLHGDKNKDIDRYLIIIISYEEKFIGIAVDTIIGKQEIVIKSLGEMLQGLKIFSGGTIFGDGSIGFVVDIEEFISKAKQIQ